MSVINKGKQGSESSQPANVIIKGHLFAKMHLAFARIVLFLVENILPVNIRILCVLDTQNVCVHARSHTHTHAHTHTHTHTHRGIITVCPLVIPLIIAVLSKGIEIQ